MSGRFQADGTAYRRPNVSSVQSSSEETPLLIAANGGDGDNNKGDRPYSSTMRWCGMVIFGVVSVVALVALGVAIAGLVQATKANDNLTLLQVGSMPAPVPFMIPPMVPPASRSVISGRNPSNVPFTVNPGNQNIFLATSVGYNVIFPKKVQTYINKDYYVYSNTSFFHTVQFTGQSDGGSCDADYDQVTWDKARAYPVAQFQGKPGSYVAFRVVDCGSIMPIETCGVKFCTEDLSECVWPEMNLQSGEISVENLTVTGSLDISMAKLVPAPEYIIVGQGVPGVEDFPLGSLLPEVTFDDMLAAMQNNKRDVKFDKKDVEQFRKHFSTLHTKNARSTVDLMPFFPTILPIPTPFPPVGAYEVATIGEALHLLQGKVIRNTTILIRAGEYKENVVLDGFETNCGTGGANDPTDMQSVLSCRGLTVIGDNRRIAGVSYTKGSPLIFKELSSLGLIFKPFTGTLDISCPTNTSVLISAFGIKLGQLGLVAGDKITLYDAETATYQTKTVVSTSNVGPPSFSFGSIIEFQEPGCSMDRFGSTVTIMPNRIIQGHAADATFGDPRQDAALLTAPAFTASKSVIMHGLWVKEPNETGNITRMPAVCLFSDASMFIRSIVCDGRNGRTYRSNTSGNVYNSNVLTISGVRNFFTNGVLSPTANIQAVDDDLPAPFGAPIGFGGNAYTSLVSMAANDLESNFPAHTIIGSSTSVRFSQLTLLNNYVTINVGTELRATEFVMVQAGRDINGVFFPAVSVANGARFSSSSCVVLFKFVGLRARLAGARIDSDGFTEVHSRVPGFGVGIQLRWTGQLGLIGRNAHVVKDASVGLELVDQARASSASSKIIFENCSIDFTSTDDSLYSFTGIPQRQTIGIAPDNTRYPGGSARESVRLRGVHNYNITEDDLSILNGRCSRLVSESANVVQHVFRLPSGKTWPGVGSSTLTFPGTNADEFVVFCVSVLTIVDARYSWTPSETVTVNGAFSALPLLKYIDQVNATVTLDLTDATLGQAVDSEFHVFSSAGTQVHKIELSGSATWNGSANKCLELPTAGSGAKFHVVSPTLVSVLSLAGGAAVVAC